MSVINDIFNNGSIWALVIAMIYIFNGLKPLIKSHLRNAHEKSLFACAERAVATVSRVAYASPSDRENEIISSIFTFASDRKIPVNMTLAKSFMNLAVTKFKHNGGSFPKPPVNKEADNK